MCWNAPHFTRQSCAIEDRMNDFQNELNKVVNGFVAEITELARRAAIDTLETALGRRAGGARLSSVRGRGGGGKRTSDEIEVLADSFHGFVAKHPGLRIEQINKQLGTNTKDLALPIRKLVAEGAIKTKGEKRSTTYFAGEAKKKRA
jgi:hypothetical protein